VGGLNGYVGRYAANRFDHRGDLAYRSTDDLMGYVQVSTGFKGGGVDPRPFNVAQASSPFHPESLTTYELGRSSRRGMAKKAWPINGLKTSQMSAAWLQLPPPSGASGGCWRAL
jgi:iron complex outermembrane receptor protein